MLRPSSGDPFVVVLPTALDVAAPAGLEPANEGVKVPCLATWLRRCMVRDQGLEP